MNLGSAIENGLNQGKRIRRAGWNHSNLFVFKQVESTIPMTTVPNMQSLPQSVKDEFLRREKATSADVGLDSPHNHSSISYSNQMCVVYPDNKIFGWAPSGTDSLANDWEILD